VSRSAFSPFRSGLLCFALSRRLEVGFLVPFAAGNFLYIGASDLVPEVNKHYGLRTNFIHFACFAGGAALLMGIKLAFE
jgi:zinc and cadmium transporter